jgi:hypothetical protein
MLAQYDIVIDENGT